MCALADLRMWAVACADPSLQAHLLSLAPPSDSRGLLRWLGGVLAEVRINGELFRMSFG